MADNTAFREQVFDKQENLELQTQQAIQDVIRAAGEQLTSSFGIADYVTAFSVPDWYIEQPANIPAPDPARIPDNWRGVQPPAFVFNPEDYMNKDLLAKYSYQSDFFDNFFEPRLKDYIDSQAYFLAQEVQDALFQESRERDLQTYNDAIDMVDRVQARRGFPVPHSMMMAARNEVAKKYQDTYADRNKEITALIADKSLQEKMHAMDKGVAMEDIRSRFQLEYGRLYWNAADYLIRKFQADVNAEVARVNAEIQMMELGTQTATKNVEIGLEDQKLRSQKEASRLDAEMNELTQQISLWKETYLARIKAAAEAVDYYKSASIGTLGSYTAIDYADKNV